MHAPDHAQDASGPVQSGVVDTRPTRVRVDLDNLSHNLGRIRAHVGVPVMAIVKANAYGHGLVPVARHLQAQGVDQLGVAFVEEGVRLRQAGVTTPVLVLGGISGRQISQYIAHDLEITVSSLDKLHQVEAAAEAMGRRAVIHLKIDTGMERIGVHSYSSRPFIEAAAASRWCELKAVYSHLACADDPGSAMTALQLERFLEACAHFDRIGAPMPLRHLANSGGVLHFPQTWLDMVRPGIALYGVLPDPASRRSIDLRPVMSLVSQVVYFKVVKAGNPVSYGATWAPSTDTRVVTIPIGYGDGYPRALSSAGDGRGGAVLIRGRRHPIVGRVCMDQFMVDIGQESAWNEDEVVLIGRQGDAFLGAEELARMAGTIPYEIMVGLNERIPRQYVGGVAE
ncbi:alanine racemase [Marilutibacter chinensis]|uniref:Alanine racemase n=1 Tax=Marilutibacter chinensis TaxID=2912247 RepID=A0ABS9HNX8_9GAMM|nr:alanine racemase [Lysobacter chinensis]MCF7220288.1 alanine racemase [Lysobacter chinensis]